MGAVPACFPWKTNGHLIEDVARLGYLDGEVWDCTYGRGTFWNRWKPDHLICTDIIPDLSPHSTDGVDFRTPIIDSFDSIVCDPPYKLNGTPTDAVDRRYGSHVVSTWQDRHRLIRDGIINLSTAVRPGGYLLLKCQDQVCSGAKRWQTIEFVNHAVTCGLVLVDRFDMIGTTRKQPMAGRTQKHAHGHPSTLLVFVRRS